MKIFGMAASPSGWLKLMNKDLSAYPLSTLAASFSSSWQYAFNSGKMLVNTGAYVKMPVSGNRVYATWEYRYRISYPANSSTTKDQRKIICIYNSDNVLLASLGMIGNSGAHKEYIFTWNADGTIKAQAEIPYASWFYWFSSANGSGSTGSVYNQSFGLDFYLDPLDSSKSCIRYITDSTVVATIDSTGIPTTVNNTPASFTFFEDDATGMVGTYGCVNVFNYLVVTDQLDLTLKPFLLTPSVLSHNTDFTGGVANIQDIWPDGLYLSSAAEAGVYFECTLAKYASTTVPLNGILSSEKIVGLQAVFHGNFVDANNGTLTFGVAIVDAVGTELAKELFNVVANKDQTYFQTQVRNFATLAAARYSDLANLKLRISLEAV